MITINKKGMLIQMLIFAIVSFIPAPAWSYWDRDIEYHEVNTTDYEPTGEENIKIEYFNDDEFIDTSNPDWMGQLPDGLRLSRLSIPGTHESVSYYYRSELKFLGHYIDAQTNTLPLATQLNAGIRYIDIRGRIDLDDNRIRLFHGARDQQEYLEAVLDTVQQFLIAHPTETILMRLQQTGNPNFPFFLYFHKEFFRGYQERYHDNPRWHDFFWRGSADGTGTHLGEIPTLGEVRGKIVILQDYSHDEDETNPRILGLEWAKENEIFEWGDTFESWDYNWNCGQANERWEQKRKHLEDAVLDVGRIYVTAFVGSDAIRPRHAAAGVRACGFIDGSPPVKGMNQRLLEHLENCSINAPGCDHIGLVQLDFPGAELIEGIIALNYDLIDKPPVITLVGESEMVLECGVDTFIDPGATAEDDYDSDVTVVIGGDTVDPLQPGLYTITYDATDNAGNAAERVIRTVIVQDTLPPEFRCLGVFPGLLWPPNHKLVPVRFYVNVVDRCDPKPRVVLTSATSNEPDDARGGGDGHTKGDIQGADIGMSDYSILLRAERNRKGDGRIYSISYSATDDSGNQSSTAITVTVPLTRPKKIRGNTAGGYMVP